MEKYEYSSNSRKKFTDPLINKKAKTVKKKTISINEKDFSGDIVLYHFIEIIEKMSIPNGKSIIDVDYRWVEFYDYNSKVKLTAIYDGNNKIVEWYFDIAKEIGKENNIPYEEDLYLDVVVTPGGEVKLLDEDELKDALESGQITNLDYENAYKEANKLVDKLNNKKDELQEFTNKYLKIIL